MTTAVTTPYAAPWHSTRSSAQDKINPDHYKSGGIETIDFIKAKLSPEELRGYLKGNALKYLSRAEMKNGAEDYSKALWYVQMLNNIDPRK